MLRLSLRVNLGGIAMKMFSTFPKAPALVKPYHQIFVLHIGYSFVGVLPLPDMQLVYSTYTANCIIELCENETAYETNTKTENVNTNIRHKITPDGLTDR